MAAVKLTGPGLNDWFAERMVKDHGPDGARERTSGPMRKAVERVIASLPATNGTASRTNEQGGAA